MAGKAYILTAAADGLGEIILLHRHIHAACLLVDHDGDHIRRGHGVDDELRRILVPQDNVDPLPIELVGYRLHPGAAHADAGPHRIDAGIDRAHRDLGPGARVPGRGEDIDQALAHLRDLQLEQLDDQLRGRAAHEELGSLGLGTDLEQIGAQPVAGTHRLPWNDVLARHQGLRVAAQVEQDGAAVGLLDHPHHQLPLAVSIGLDHLGALGLPDLLHDHLLCRLRRDTPEEYRLHGLLDKATDRDGRIPFPGLGRGKLAVRRLRTLLRFRVLHDLPATEGAVLSSFPVDRNPGVDVAGGLPAGSGRQRRLHGVEDDLFRHLLLVGNGFDHQ